LVTEVEPRGVIGLALQVKAPEIAEGRDILVRIHRFPPLGSAARSRRGTATTAGSAASPGPGFLTGTYAYKEQAAPVQARRQCSHRLFLRIWGAAAREGGFLANRVRAVHHEVSFCRRYKSFTLRHRQ
jgi:hypothetical protein